MYIWELRNPDGGMLGFEFARSISDEFTEILAHALPSVIDVVVRNADGMKVAEGFALKADGDTPMASLRLFDGKVSRRQVWPTEADLDKAVILPGGEVGILKSWWNPPDGSEWRWQIELYNHR